MKIELNLLDNGLDFILEALNHVWKKDSLNNPNLWKYSILHFFSGAELILKERLKREHWSLIFEDVGNANEQKLIQGDFISVSHNEIIKRLKGICHIELNDEPLTNLRKIRNKFEHFEVNVSVEDCKRALANALQELTSFWDEHIILFCNEEQNNKFAIIKAIINDFDAYVKLTFEKNSQMIKNITESGSGILIPCNNCRNVSLIVFKKPDKACECFVCGNQLQKTEYLKITREDEENDSWLPKGDYEKKCEICGKESRVRYIPRWYNDDSIEPDYYYCINCLHKNSDLTYEEKLNKRIEELKKNHSVNEIIEILQSEIEE